MGEGLTKSRVCEDFCVVSISRLRGLVDFFIVGNSLCKGDVEIVDVKLRRVAVEEFFGTLGYENLIFGLLVEARCEILDRRESNLW